MPKPVVLIVEDDSIARFVFKKLITRLDFIPYEATNGQEGLDMMDKHPEISHVFLDLNMPVLDGYGFLHYLNSGGRYDHLNIYITSVSNEHEFTATVRQRNIGTANIRGYNKKPFDMAQLTRSLLADDTSVKA